MEVIKKSLGQMGTNCYVIWDETTLEAAVIDPGFEDPRINDIINDNKLKTISLGLLNFNGERGSEYGPLMAAISITISVPFVIYILFQEKIENGIAAGAVKG